MAIDLCASEFMSDGYMTVNSLGVVTFANDSARRWLGAPDREVSGTPVQALLPARCALRGLLHEADAPHLVCQGPCRGVRVKRQGSGLELLGPPQSPAPGSSLAEALNGAQQLAEVTEIILTHPDWSATGASLALFDPVRAALRLMARGADAAHVVRQLPIQTDHPLCATFRSGRSRVLDPLDWPEPSAGSARELLLIPLVAAARPLGVLVLTMSESGLLERIRPLIAVSAAALARAGAFDETHRAQVRYRTLLEVTHAALWELDQSFEIQGASPNWEALTGQSFTEYAGRGFMDVIHPADRSRLEGEIERGVQGRAPFELRGRMRRADGQYRHVVALALPVPEERGSGQGWAGSIQDVTEEIWAAEWESPSQHFLTLAAQGEPAWATFAAALEELARVTGARSGLLVGRPAGSGAVRLLAQLGSGTQLHGYLPESFDGLSGRPGWLAGRGEDRFPGESGRALSVPLHHQERLIAAALLDVPDTRAAGTDLDHLRWLQVHLAPIVHSAQLRDALERSEAHAHSIVSALDEGVVMIDAAGQLLAANRAARHLLDLHPAEPLPALNDSIWALENDRGERLPVEQYPAMIALRTGRATRQVLMARTRRDGQRLWLSVNALPVEDRSGVVVSFSDVTEAVTLRQQLTAQAFQDDLTGLSNRRAFQQAALEQRGPHAAALLIDVDHFKAVNDTHGHHVGDELLREVAQRLRREAPVDALIARLGGDEFGMLHPAMSVDQACVIAERIVHVVRQPVTVGAVQAQVSASVGVATAGQCGGVNLHRAADLAMYSVKRSGRSGWALFDPRGHLPA